MNIGRFARWLSRRNGNQSSVSNTDKRLASLPVDAIYFHAPVISQNKLVFEVNSGRSHDNISFSVPRDFHAHTDCMAVCLATLCGSHYKRLEFGFPVSDKARTAIADWSRAEVISAGTCEARAPGSAMVLNFSGGFDSMATYCLAPAQQLRLAVDFGGYFGRERRFFETLAPDIVCETDIRTKGYARHSWMFMGAASLLYADYLGLETVGYGTNFESSLWHYRTRPEQAPKAPNNALISGISLNEAGLVRGLTGFGIARIMRKYAEFLVPQSLVSLAPERSVKRMRKNAVYDASFHVAGGPPPAFDDYEYPDKCISLGDDYTEDFLGLILARLYGKPVVSRWMKGLEKIDDEELAALDVDWAFKFNPTCEAYIPEHLRTVVMAKLASAGVEPFAPSDWQHYRGFRRILEGFHKFPVN